MVSLQKVMRLLNVRLRPEDAARVTALRARHVPISQLLRDAIRSEYERLRRPLRARDVDALLRALYERHPDPPGLAPPSVDVREPRAVRKAAVRRLRRRGRRR